MKEIRLITPSLSLNKKDEPKIKKAQEYFKSLGYNLTLGKYVFDKDKTYGCSSIENRVKDLNAAFLDKNVEIILCGNGGYNVNQILPYLDYKIIKENPKIIIGYSDITALLLAIYKKTNLTTYYGPMLSGFSSGNVYTLECFEKILKNEDFYLTSSREIEDYERIKNKTQKITLKNKGMVVLQKGKARGKMMGGNLCTLNLLQGTPYMPNLKDCVLFLEDDGDDLASEVFNLEFDRNLESLLQSIKGNIKGIVFGRFQVLSEMTLKKLKKCIKNKAKLKNIPIVAGVDFGHTNPMLTLPLGDFCSLEVTVKKINIKIERRKKE